MPQTNTASDPAMTSAVSEHDEIACLAARANLACATVEICEVYREVLRQRREAEEGINAAARAQTAQNHYGAACRAFFAAWQQGASAFENMRVIEVAVQGYADWFDLDDELKAGIERLSLDFMRKTVRRLPPPGAAVAPALGDAGATQRDEAVDDLEERLERLLAAGCFHGGHPQREVTAAATHGIHAAIDTVLRLGWEPERVQLTLDWWTKATGGPKFTLSAGARPSRH